MLYPLKLNPSASPRLWGGDKLKDFVPSLDVVNAAEPLGEAWLVYAANAVSNGPWAGRTLQEVATELGEALLGSSAVARYGTQVPLLAKFLDAGASLSVQVHPDDDYARSREADSGHLGKTEAWYVLQAEPGARIIWGFEKKVTPAQVRAAVEEGKLETLLHYVPVRAGDVIYNPAGTVHALGPGLFIFEIQQSSDLTYRLYDYDRRDAAGKARELHLNKGLEVASLSAHGEAKVAPKALTDSVTELLSTEFFVMERWEVSASVKTSTAPTSLELLTVIEGKLSVSAGETVLPLTRGDAAVLPAHLGAYQLAGRGVMIRCYLP